MTSKEIFKKLKENNQKQDEAEFKKDGKTYRLKLGTNNNLCSIDVCTDMKNSAKVNNYISKINSEQQLLRYKMQDDELHLQTTLWVDRNPTNTSLKEIVNLLVSHITATVSMLEEVIKDE